MRYPLIIWLFMVLMFFSPLSSNAESTGGKDVNPDEDVPFSIISRDSPSIDNTKWTLTIEMNQDAHDNETTFEIVTQICTNDGVCDQPKIMDADITERLHTISLTPPEDHSYVNWRVKAIDSDGNKTNHPHGDWYKTWSSCWYNDGTYGGVDATSDGCAVGEANAQVPGFLFCTSIIAIISSTVVQCRNRQ